MNFQPLKMHPCYKEYLWGGTHLKTDFGKDDAPAITAESWELAAHADGVSAVESGAMSGKTLNDLAAIDRMAFFGKDCPGETFPLLVKLIDAEKDLSIQVHPSDITALDDRGEQGKAEMWYIVDCRPASYIYLGLSRAVSKEEFARRAKNGTICQVLNKVPVKKGDVFYILPGTIHAICAGIVIAEIQQNSNTTFRVYDYQRRGADGKMRPLHLERAMDVINYMPIIPEACKTNSGVVFPGFTLAEMFSCQYFRAFRLDIHPEVDLLCDGNTFHHLLCVEGEGKIFCTGEEYALQRGDSYFMPAQLGKYTIKGKCRVLLSRI